MKPLICSYGHEVYSSVDTTSAISKIADNSVTSAGTGQVTNLATVIIISIFILFQTVKFGEFWKNQRCVVIFFRTFG